MHFTCRRRAHRRLDDLLRAANPPPAARVPEAAARRHTAHQPLRGVLWGLNATRGLRASLPLELAIADVGVPRIEHPAEDARVEEAGARKLPAIDGEASSMRGMSHARVSPVNQKKRRT